jgi:hypothetical protein
MHVLNLSVIKSTLARLPVEKGEGGKNANDNCLGELNESINQWRYRTGPTKTFGWLMLPQHPM